MSSHSKTYTAVQAVAPGRLELTRKPFVEPGSGQVRLRVEACGVCHSDAATVEGAFPIQWPRVPGHEAVGVIDAIGGNVEGWTLDVCQKLKDDEVQIYTVLLQADTAANRTLYTKCASSAANYYPTNDVSQLQGVFLNIGSKISQLRLTN